MRLLYGVVIKELGQVEWTSEEEYQYPTIQINASMPRPEKGLRRAGVSR